MADTNWTQCNQILPRNQRDSKSTSEPVKGKFQVHQTYAHSPQGAQNSNTTRTQSTWRIHHRVRSKKHCLIRLDKLVPHTLTTRKQVHFGDGRNWQQCDTSRTHQGLQGWGTHASVSDNDAKTVKSGNNSQEAHIGQWSVRIPENNNTGWIKNANRAGTTRHTPQKCSRSVNNKFQGTLTQCPCRYRKYFPSSLWYRLLPQA